MSTAAELGFGADRIVTLAIPAAVAERLEAMSQRHDLTVEEIVRYMAGNIASLIDFLPAAAKRAARAHRRGETND